MQTICPLPRVCLGGDLGKKGEHDDAVQLVPCSPSQEVIVTICHFFVCGTSSRKWIYLSRLGKQCLFLGSRYFLWTLYVMDTLVNPSSGAFLLSHSKLTWNLTQSRFWCFLESCSTTEHHFRGDNNLNGLIYCTSGWLFVARGQQNKRNINKHTS